MKHILFLSTVLIVSSACAMRHGELPRPNLEGVTKARNPLYEKKRELLLAEYKTIISNTQLTDAQKVAQLKELKDRAKLYVKVQNIIAKSIATLSEIR